MRQITQRINIRRLVFSGIGALVLDILLWAGYYIEHFHTVFGVGGPFALRLLIWILTGIGLLAALYLLYGLIDRCDLPAGKPLSLRKVFFFCFAVFLLISCYYLWKFWPGVVTTDSYVQINQGLGYTALTDHHPILHTLFIGLTIRIGRALFGTINRGILVYTAAQMICVSAMASGVICYLVRKGINRVVCFLIFLFFAIHPMIGAYSVTMWKDVWTGWFILLFVCCLLEMCTNEEAFFEGKTGVTVTVVTGLLVQFSKKIGLAVVAAAFLFVFLFFFRRHKKKVLCLILITIGGYVIVHAALMHALGAEKGKAKEALSVPMQQIARTVAHKDGTGDITEEQKKLINKYLPYDELVDRYNSHISDPVKIKFKEERFQKDKMAFLKLWLDLGMKNKKIYIDSFLAGSSGYWYPDVKYWQISAKSYLQHLAQEKEKGKKIYDPDAENYQENRSRNDAADRVVQRYNDIRDIPVLGAFFQIAAYFWAVFIAFLYFLYSRRYRMVIPCFAVAAVLLTCLISPVYAECRYAFPAILSAPVILAFLLQKNDLK